MKNDKLETIDIKDLDKATGGAGELPGSNPIGDALGGAGLGTLGRPPKRPPGGSNPNCTVCGMG